MVKGVAQGKLSEDKILDRPNEDAKARPSFLAVFVTSQALACKYYLFIYIYISDTWDTMHSLRVACSADAAHLGLLYGRSLMAGLL